MQSQSESMIAELEVAVRSGSAESRVNMLRQVANLFLNDAEVLSEEQVKVFDDVLCLLTNQIENNALAELSGRLAAVDNAPIEMIRRLAHDEAIEVAGPVLTESKRLTTRDLSEIARTKGQAHLLAISGRDALEEAVTDLLVERGNRQVVHTLAANSGARFSASGYGVLVEKAEGDDALAEKVGLRRDIPTRLLKRLLLHAAGSVRQKLLTRASPQDREEILRVLDSATKAVANTTAAPDDSTAAEQLVRSLHDSGELDDKAILDFATRAKFDEVTAALALLCSAPLDVVSGLLTGIRHDAVMIACKAAELKWPTVEAILRNREGSHALSHQVIEFARNDYNRLSVVTAQKTLRFMQVRATVQR
jgi:uncharacterized protein (DUF2336 family)